MEAFENKGIIYEFGKFVLDPGERTLFSDGVPLHLPAKEFDTLIMLVEHNGRALTKEEMMSALWQDAFVEESNLAKQISRLRKIINTNGEEYIETIPKHGYRFSADLRTNDPGPVGPVILERKTVKRVTLAVEKETEPEPQALSAGEPNRFSWTKVAVGGLLATLIVAAVVVWRQRTSGALGRIKTVAVLPLRPLNGDEDARAIGLGLTDALITRLGGLRRIIVRPTDAVVSVPGQADPIETGRKLNVDAILEGTIQRADGKFRVNARLLKTDTGEQIWTEKFDEAAGGILDLQDALSAKIAKTLAFELTSTENTQLARRETDNPDAFAKYLRGRYFQGQNTADGLNKSIEFYQQAIILDPKFAEAYAGIADANMLLFNFGMLSAAETVPNARQAVNRALALNPDLSSAYTTTALIQFLIDKNWPDAERSLQRALELNPNNADAYLRYGYFLLRVGKLDEALKELEEARQLNPMSPIIPTDMGLAFLSAHRYSDAIDSLEKTAADNPQFSLPLWFLASSYESVGDEEKAFAVSTRALEIDGSGELATRLRSVKETNGIRAADQLWIESLLEARKRGHVSGTDIAWRYARVGDRENTLTWLETALAENDPALSQIKYLTRYDFVRDDPRFKALESNVLF